MALVTLTPNITALLYLFSAVCFILAIKGLASPTSARTGNILGIIGMIVAITTTFLGNAIAQPYYVLACIGIGGIIGTIIALKVKMTAMPQLVAGFHSLVGLAAVLIAVAAFFSPESFDIGTTDNISKSSLIELSLGAIIGAITFSGSIIAFLKLQGTLGGAPLRFIGQHLFNLLVAIGISYTAFTLYHTSDPLMFWIMIGLSFFIGFLLILPIGGADMPVVISMLNSYSGWAAAGIGFTLNNSLLIITGALVGASGAILSYVMCKAMNRSIFNVIFGGLGEPKDDTLELTHISEQPVNQGNADDAAFMMSGERSIIIIPGYGMAVAQAQHALKEMADLLLQKDIQVRYAIHPVAGRMPGHMNVLLAEANVPYEQVLELDEINRDFSSTDIAFIIGANDITNPAAKTNKSSPIYGMPVFNVRDAGHVLFVKRSLSSGYAGVENELFYDDNTVMLFGDAKQMCEQIVKALEAM